MIRCGYGNLELEFVGSRGCLTNITQLAAVEPDADQMAELKTRVSQLLPAVRDDLFQETAQSWNGVGKGINAQLTSYADFGIHEIRVGQIHRRPTRPEIRVGLVLHVLHGSGAYVSEHHIY